MSDEAGSKEKGIVLRTCSRHFFSWYKNGGERLAIGLPNLLKIGGRDYLSTQRLVATIAQSPCPTRRYSGKGISTCSTAVP